MTISDCVNLVRLSAFSLYTNGCLVTHLTNFMIKITKPIHTKRLGIQCHRTRLLWIYGAGFRVALLNISSEVHEVCLYSSDG